MASTELVARWWSLTRETMPALAKERGWPVYLDHCFQRILLDSAVEANWRTVIGSPAYKEASDAQLSKAIELGEAVVAGEADLAQLNHRSLKWRGKIIRHA